MQNRCRIVGSDQIFETTQDLAKHLGLRSAEVLRCLYNPDATTQGLKIEFVDLPTRKERDRG